MKHRSLRRSLALLGASLAMSYATAACADPDDARPHLQVAAGVQVGLAGLLPSGDSLLDGAFTGEVRRFGPSGHGWMVRGRFVHVGKLFGELELDAVTVDGAWAYRRRLAGGPSAFVQLLGGAYAGLGVTVGEVEVRSCGLCFGERNVSTSRSYAGLGALAGANLDLRVGGWLLGASVEGRLTAGVGSPPFRAWAEGTVLLRTGVDLPL